MRTLKTWKKFRNPGENFQKSFGHPVFRKFCCNKIKKKLKIKKL